MGNTVIITGRLLFPELFKAKSLDDSKAKFSTTLLVEKGEKSITELNALITKTAAEKWGKASPKKFKYEVIVDGDDSEHEGNHNHWLIRFSSNEVVKPQVFMPNKELATERQSFHFYSGCHARIKTSVYCWDNKFGKGVTLNLLAVQKIKDGDRIGSKPEDHSDSFDVVEDVEHVPF